MSLVLFFIDGSWHVFGALKLNGSLSLTFWKYPLFRDLSRT